MTRMLGIFDAKFDCIEVCRGKSWRFAFEVLKWMEGVRYEKLILSIEELDYFSW